MLLLMSNIQKYLPTIYDGVLEMEAITSIEDELFEEISTITDKTVLEPVHLYKRH